MPGWPSSGCEIESPTAQQAIILLGTDDASRLWVNGKVVYNNTQHRAAAPEQDEVKVDLRPGRNMLLLKISNGNGPHGLYLTIVAEEPLTLAKD